MVTGVSALSFDGGKVAEYAQYFYTKPWFRAAPYFIGMFGAITWLDESHDSTHTNANRGTLPIIVSPSTALPPPPLASQSLILPASFN